MKVYNHIMLLMVWVAVMLVACDSNTPGPVINTISPTFGPEETLVTIEGENLAGIKEISFSGVPINFNTAYNADQALLFRIPSTVPLGPHEVKISTDFGAVLTDFRVTREAPEIFRVLPESAAPGEEVTIYGENFFEPIEVFFFDSVQAQVVNITPDSIKVTVPEGIQKGFVRVNANGGSVLSPVQFFTVGTILVNDFDGNGVRAETNKWIFVGAVNENGSNAVQSQNPAPIDGNFLKLSGRDETGIRWIGGAQNHFGFPGDAFELFGIRTAANNTLLQLDVNNNGRENTHIILILLEKDGSINDFTHQLKVDGTGWETLEVPLTRFQDLNGKVVDPSKVRVLKIHLIDEDKTGAPVEVNVDNIRFLELL